MQKFRLSITVFDVESVASLLDKWIGLAVASEILTIDTSSSISYDFDNDFYLVESIEIVAPSLQQCTLVCVKRPCIIDMDGCADLKYFNLTFSDILDQEFHNLISKFPLLEKLVVRNCFHLERVALSSNRLKELQIHQVIHSSRLSYIDIDAPNLLTFSYECYSKPARSINVSHPCSWKVGVSLSAMDMKVLFDVAEVTPSSYAALLDCLLWICYPRPRILSIKAYHGPSSIQFIMWLYKKMMTRDAKCCSGHKIKCWKQYLKDVKIVASKDSKPNLQPETIRFCLDWCFSEHIDLA
ncbi:hypothetical protein Dsin_020042 [Dipteronia sinensis]|uniref:At1g61320/AtMIF1 LRR domain-containing protein n=1 Tax=Dipteronia sinensis TaxID=43782 RepID=A0AAE0A9V6_9ROSI|nr:hypothetical protein Dsin_020042 [Dipteronia sinensis]